MTQTATITAARAAEAILASQLHATAEALSTIARNPIDAAVDHVRREAAALKERLDAARAAVALELAGVLAELTGFAADLSAGMTLQAEPIALSSTLPVEPPSIAQETSSPLASPEASQPSDPTTRDAWASQPPVIRDLCRIMAEAEQGTQEQPATIVSTAANSPAEGCTGPITSPIPDTSTSTAGEGQKVEKPGTAPRQRKGRRKAGQ